MNDWGTRTIPLYHRCLDEIMMEYINDKPKNGVICSYLHKNIIFCPDKMRSFRINSTNVPNIQAHYIIHIQVRIFTCINAYIHADTPTSLLLQAKHTCNVMHISFALQYEYTCNIFLSCFQYIFDCALFDVFKFYLF